jgi:hypothetical protein
MQSGKIIKGLENIPNTVMCMLVWHYAFTYINRIFKQTHTHFISIDMYYI